MKIGVVYPQTEFGSDPLAVRDYAQAAEGLGYAHVVAYDHVLGANPDRPGGWNGPYTYQTPFQEVFVLLTYMAAFTRKLGLAPGILILPQRQTALVAKQAATLDVLSGGRLRLGVGLGWNEVEYTALGEDFHNRGRRIEEQVQLLRLLWSQPLVSFSGKWHTIPDAGLNPLPVQRPIPLWLGGQADPAIRRAAQIGDGWMLNYRAADAARQPLEKFKQYLGEAGRRPDSVGIEARLYYGDGNARLWSAAIQDWLALGVTQFSLNTMGCGFTAPSAHLTALRTFADAILKGGS